MCCKATAPVSIAIVHHHRKQIDKDVIQQLEAIDFLRKVCPSLLAVAVTSSHSSSSSSVPSSATSLFDSAILFYTMLYINGCTWTTHSHSMDNYPFTCKLLLVRYLKDCMNAHQEYKRKRDVVLSAFWEIISGHISSSSRSTINSFAEAYPNLIPASAYQAWINATDFTGQVEYYLAYLLCMYNNTLHGIEITSSPSDLVRYYKTVLQHISKYDTHPCHSNAFETAKLILSKETKMLAYTPKQRSYELEYLLHQNGCKLRQDSKFCQKYVKGTTCADVEHVVGVMMIARGLFSYGHRVFSELREKFETLLIEKAMRGPFREDNVPFWIEAARGIIESDEFSREAIGLEKSLTMVSPINQGPCAYAGYCDRFRGRLGAALEPCMQSYSILPHQNDTRYFGKGLYSSSLNYLYT
jgi:hypothetical protein